MTCYNYVDKNYDEIIPYTHNTTHVIILPLEIIIIIHYTICLTYNTFNNLLLHEGYALLKCFSLLLLSVDIWTVWEYCSSTSTYTAITNKKLYTCTYGVIQLLTLSQI